MKEILKKKERIIEEGEKEGKKKHKDEGGRKRRRREREKEDMKTKNDKEGERQRGIIKEVREEERIINKENEGKQKHLNEGIG